MKLAHCSCSSRASPTLGNRAWERRLLRLKRLRGAPRHLAVGSKCLWFDLEKKQELGAVRDKLALSGWKMYKPSSGEFFCHVWKT